MTEPFNFHLDLISDSNSGGNSPTSSASSPGPVLGATMSSVTPSALGDQDLYNAVSAVMATAPNNIRALIEEVVNRWHAAYTAASGSGGAAGPSTAPTVAAAGSLMASRVKLDKPEKFDGTPGKLANWLFNVK